jgi:hypothetical protein
VFQIFFKYLLIKARWKSTVFTLTTYAKAMPISVKKIADITRHIQSILKSSIETFQIPSTPAFQLAV